MFNKSNYLIIGVLCLGFFIRLGFLLRNPNFDYTDFKGKLPSELFYFQGNSPHDSQEYKALALNMLKHHRFSWNSEPVAFRTPGYPFFITAIYSLFPGDDTKTSTSKPLKDWIVMLIQVFLSTASIYLIYLIGKNIWDKKNGSENNSYGYWAGIIPAFLFSLNPTSILFSSLFMAETLFVFCILLGSWLFLKNKNPCTGLIFGISALIRPIAFYIFIPLVFLQGNFKKGIIFLILFFLPILPWIARNVKVYNLPLFTSIQGCNLLIFNASILESEELGISLQEARDKLQKKLDFSTTNPLQLSRQAQKIAIKRILKSPFRYTFIHFKKAFHIFLSTKSDDIILRTIGRDVTQSRLSRFVFENKESSILKSIIVLSTGIESLVIISFLLLAVIGFMRSPQYPNLLFILIIGYFFIFSGVVNESRFRLPLIPYIYLLATSTLWLKRKK